MGNPVVHFELMSKNPDKPEPSLFTDPEGRMTGLWKAKQ
jgi:hypothetical protein